MGATCVKLEPPSGDPMGLYNPKAYAELHSGVRIAKADLKTELGQRALHRELAKTDVLTHLVSPVSVEKAGLGLERFAQTIPPAQRRRYRRRTWRTCRRTRP